MSNHEPDTGRRRSSGERPLIAVTMGDPAGIGPEVTVKAAAREEARRCCRLLAVGDASILIAAQEMTDVPLAIHPIADVAHAEFRPSTLDVLDLDNVDVAALAAGQVSAAAGRASVAYVRKAVELTQEGLVDGIATGPINKEALRAAGIPYIGHTELLAALTGEERVTTMLATPGLRVVHVTRHVPLAEVAALISKERVVETLHITDRGLRQMGIREPRLAVAALNPHSGDGGLLGREEIEEIEPAVEEARQEGIDARGPIPADSVFFQAIEGAFDAVVAMYHDQGHIPIKTHDFARSVTVTLGLPIVRTSVDHGTAFEIAWRGKADETSMVEAIRLAGELVAGRRAG
ncbi:MAG: 4-hydroxythreonine-4-phosphate dehydrogenase PdxA [Chloroflexota bacterium]